MAAGGHFFSDVAFAGVFTFLVIWLAYRWLYRRPGAAAFDARIERALESMAASCIAFASGARPAQARRSRRRAPGRDYAAAHGAAVGVRRDRLRPG